MNFFLSEYIKKMTKNDLINLAISKNIYLTSKETNNAYTYIKNNYKQFFNKEIDINEVINQAKKILNPNNYQKLLNIYSTYKDKI